MNRIQVIDIYGVPSINDNIIVNFINYMAVLIPEDTNTILLFIKCINDVLKNMPTVSKSIYMYINSVMIEFRNGVRNPNKKLSNCIDKFFYGLQFCAPNNIACVMLTLLEDLTRSLTFYELVNNGISDNKISDLLFNSKNINKSYNMKFSQPSGLNIPLYIETENPNVIKKVEINERFQIVNEIRIPTLRYMAEFAPEYTNLASNIHNLIPQQKKCVCISNLQNIGGLLYQMINNMLCGIIFNKSQKDIIKENVLLFNRSGISRCTDCRIKSLLYDTIYMLAHLQYDQPIKYNNRNRNNNIGNVKVSNINNLLNRVFKYNLKGGNNILLREGFHIPNTRTTIQHTGFLKLFSADTNYKTIPDIEKQLDEIYQLSLDKHSVPLYCSLVKACIIIKYIIPMCLEDCMNK